MTIREKLCQPFGGLKTETLNELEVVVDDFAIGFAHFLAEHTYSCYESGWSNDFGNKELTTKELLKIYKKEKSYDTRQFIISSFYISMGICNSWFLLC
jgi:hypothetical protein